MKRKPRRKGAASEEVSDNDSSCGSPVKEKENLSPPKNGRQSMDAHQHQFITLLKDFDQNVAMTKKDIYTRLQMVGENLTVPFTTFIIKLPSAVKNMKWGDYLKMKAKSNEEKKIDLPVVKLNPETCISNHKFLAPSTKSNLETPAVRQSSRLAMSKKFPAITPKFDPSTPGVVNRRLPKPGEMLVSLRGSPVAIPTQMNPIPMRSVSNLAATEEKDVLVALLSNPETLNSALKDKTTCKAFIKAFNDVGKILKE